MLRRICRKETLKLQRRSTLTMMALAWIHPGFTIADDDSPLNVNLQFKTWGGKQFWTDIRIQGDWRIQRNHYTHHCRILDNRNVRRAWGSFNQCQERFDALVADGTIRPYRKKIVVLLHGVIRTRNSLEPVGRYLKGRQAVDVLSWGYASTRQTITDHAEQFGELLSHFPEESEIYLVGHSLGNIVVRRYLKINQDDRIKRMVMLAPPNQGSSLARAVDDNVLFETLWGVSGKELANGFPELEAQLATPDFEFGIIAGKLDSQLVRNPLVKGPGDLVVSVEETKLRGAVDFRTVNSTHTRIMNQKETLEYVHRFLKNGYFQSPNTKQPIQ